MLICRTLILHINFFTNFKIVWEKLFYFCPKSCQNFKKKFKSERVGRLKLKKYWKDEDLEVAQAGKWGDCGSDEILLWLALFSRSTLNTVNSA